MLIGFCLLSRFMIGQRSSSVSDWTMHLCSLPSLRPCHLSTCGNCKHLNTRPSPFSTSSSSEHHHHQQYFGMNFHPAPCSTPPSLGLLRLLQEQGITASPQPAPYTFHSHLPTPTHPTAHPTVREEDRGGAQSLKEERTKTLFSFNLVEKLQNLGLHTVAARGVAVGSQQEGERTYSQREAVRHPSEG